MYPEGDPLGEPLLAPITLEGLHFVVDCRHMLVQISSVAEPLVAIPTSSDI